MWNLEPDLSWMTEPKWAAAPLPDAAKAALEAHVETILAAVHGPDVKQFDPITLAVMIAALSALACKVVDACWEHCFKRASFNPFYYRKCVRNFAAVLDTWGIQSPRETAVATLDHFRHMDKDERAGVFGRVRAAYDA